jgi:hypothetical protein
VLLRLFAGATAGDCAAACDANDSGAEDLADAVYVLGYLFGGGSPPPSPWPTCAEHASELACRRRCPN